MYKDRIRDLREDKGLTQKELADFLQVHRTTYSDYELGRLNVPVSALHRLADFLGVSIDYLLGRTNIKHHINKKRTCRKKAACPHFYAYRGIWEPWRRALTTGNSSPVRKRISAPPPVQM